MKIIHGRFSLADSNKSLTLDAPIPTNNSTNSDPAAEIKVEFVSDAIAFANKVLPVPGGPSNKIPFGISAPISLNNSLFSKYEMISLHSSMTSGLPAQLERDTFAITISMSESFSSSSKLNGLNILDFGEPNLFVFIGEGMFCCKFDNTITNDKNTNIGTEYDINFIAFVIIY